jgi:hypothetical protein
MATRKTLIADPRVSADINPLLASIPPQLAPAPSLSTKSTDEVAKELHDDVVDVTVGKAFNLTDDRNVIHTYTLGTRRMPRSHAEHWYAGKHGVKIVN